MRTTLSKAVCIIAARAAGPSRQGIHRVSQVSLTKDQVQHIAMLARLRLDDSELDDVVSKLSNIVDFVDQLQEAATDDVLPMAHPLNQTQRLRPDQVSETDQRDHYQENAPAVRDGFYLVPKVIE